MKTSMRVGLLAGTIFFPLLPLAAAPGSTPQDKSGSSEAKPYVLFMRTDVSVGLNKRLYPIRDVSGRDFIVSMAGKKATVPMAGGSHELEFQHVLTLARTSASLTGLESERSYTPGRDPKMQRQRDAVLAEAAIGDNESLAEGQFIRGLNKDFVVLNTENKDPITGAPAPMGAQATAAELARRSAVAAANAFQAEGQAETLRESNVTSGGFARLAAENDMAQELYDAVSVRFTVSSQVYLEKPYLVVITRFHTRDDKPGVARNAVYAKALDSIGSKPAKIDVLQGGFPPGFEIEELQVHLYDNGQEVPTDVAQKRVPLTRDEAFEYLKIEYVSGHKGGTLTATPALGLPDKDERLKLTPNQWKGTYYAKVSKDGLPLGTYLDEACGQPVDETVAALAQNVRYYPAMEKGKLVEGVARLSLSELKL